MVHGGMVHLSGNFVLISAYLARALASGAATALADRSLQELRREGHYRTAMGAVQSEAGREQSSPYPAARRANRSDGRLLEHGRRGTDVAWIYMLGS